MITKGDDYPLHQTPEPIAYVGANRNFYDRYFFNGYDRSGEVFFAAALGVYPYVNVMDCAFSVVLGGVQHNVYASKVMHMERLQTEVGPMKIDIMEPLRVIQISCNDPANGIKAKLRFTARTEAHEEPRFMRRAGAQVIMDVTRIIQNGCWSGWIEVKGRRLDVQADNFWGTRDRSWGIRPLGEADTQPNPYAPLPQFYWLWCPLNFENFAVHYFVNDDEYGHAWNTGGTLIPLLTADNKDQEPMTQMKSCSSKLLFKPGRRHAQAAEVKFINARDETLIFALTPKWNFYMRGIGYGHEYWKHGSYHGEFEQGYDEFVISDAPASNLHIQAMCDVRLTTPSGAHQGQGILEQLIIGPHKPSGFRDLYDTLS